jgi:hypothetical protein
MLGEYNQDISNAAGNPSMPFVVPQLVKGKVIEVSKSYGGFWVYDSLFLGSIEKIEIPFSYRFCFGSAIPRREKKDISFFNHPVDGLNRTIYIRKNVK